MSDLSGFDTLKMAALKQAAEFIGDRGSVADVTRAAESFLEFLKTGKAGS